MLMRVHQFLDFATSQQEAIITFSSSNMILNIHSIASYLYEKNTRSCAGGHYFLSTDKTNSSNNDAVINISQRIRNVMSAAAEAELGALFINAKTAVPEQETL